MSSQNWFSLHENSSSNGCPKNATFRIITLQADTSERSDSKRLESDLSEVSAFRIMILKVRFFGTPCTPRENFDDPLHLRVSLRGYSSCKSGQCVLFQ